MKLLKAMPMRKIPSTFLQRVLKSACLVGSVLALNLTTLNATAAEASLADLFERVKSGSAEEAQRNQEREAKFASSAAERAAMLRDVQAKVRQQERLKDRLKDEFDSNDRSQNRRLR
jgi:hypothetical protein